MKVRTTLTYQPIGSGPESAVTLHEEETDAEGAQAAMERAVGMAVPNENGHLTLTCTASFSSSTMATEVLSDLRRHKWRMKAWLATPKHIAADIKRLARKVGA